MFERFSDSARQVVIVAQQQARELRHPSIGTEHLLLGLAAQQSGPAAEVLHARGITPSSVRSGVTKLLGDGLDAEALSVLGIDLDQVRTATEARFGAGALDPAPRGRIAKGHIPFSGRGKAVLELALQAARSIGSQSISAGHVLLGIIDEDRGLAARILRDQGVDLVELRAATITAIGSAAA